MRGGRFVAGFDGEQYALPEAVPLLRAVRRRGPGEPVHASAADPLNFRGILTPDERVSPLSRRKFWLPEARRVPRSAFAEKAFDYGGEPRRRLQHGHVLLLW